MRNDFPPLLKHLPPKTRAALSQAVTRCSDALDMGPDWVQRWIGFTVVADALSSHTLQGASAFEFKGDAAIELRLRQLRRALGDTVLSLSDTPVGVTPRTTKDLDATFRGTLVDLEQALRDALAVPRHQFAFRVESETPNAPFMRRFRIRLGFCETRYNAIVEQPFTNVPLAVSIYEGTHLPPDMVPAFSLRPFGIDGPEHLPCIPLIKQIAQKLHAVTEPPTPTRANDRFRDLLDLVMLRALVPPSQKLRAVCEETFQLRDRHGWPPVVVAYPHWIAPMEQRAMEMGLDHRSADDIVAHVVAYVRAIESAE